MRVWRRSCGPAMSKPRLTYRAAGQVVQSGGTAERLSTEAAPSRVGWPGGHRSRPLTTAKARARTMSVLNVTPCDASFS